MCDKKKHMAVRVISSDTVAILLDDQKLRQEMLSRELFLPRLFKMLLRSAGQHLPLDYALSQCGAKKEVLQHPASRAEIASVPNLALTVILAICQYEDTMDYILAENVVDALVSLLSQPDGHIQKWTALWLAKLTEHEAVRAWIVNQPQPDFPPHKTKAGRPSSDQNMISRLLELIRNPRASTRLWAIQSLRLLLKHNDLWPAVSSRHVLKTIFEVMSDERQEMGVRILACDVLMSACGYDFMRKQMVDSGIESSIRKMLPASIPAILVEDALTECNASTSLLEHRIDPIASGSILGRRVLYELCDHENIRIPIMNALKSMLSSEKDHDSICLKSAAAICVAKMARHDDARREFLVMMDVIQSLLDLHWEDRKRSQYALRELGKYKDTEQWLSVQGSSLREAFERCAADTP